jgi:hypothetical protein
MMSGGSGIGAVENRVSEDGALLLALEQMSEASVQSEDSALASELDHDYEDNLLNRVIPIEDGRTGETVLRYQRTNSCPSVLDCSILERILTKGQQDQLARIKQRLRCSLCHRSWFF